MTLFKTRNLENKALYIESKERYIEASNEKEAIEMTLTLVERDAIDAFKIRLSQATINTEDVNEDNEDRDIQIVAAYVNVIKAK